MLGKEAIARRLPRSWNAALAQLRRDVTVLRRRAAGYGSAPVISLWQIERVTIGPRPHVAALTVAAGTVATVAPGALPLAIRIRGRTHHMTALPGATVLEVGLAAGAPLRFSCAVGGCGACKLRVVEGKVDVEEPNCLTEAERAAGFVLACVGRPCGPCVLERVERAIATRGGP